VIGFLAATLIGCGDPSVEDAEDFVRAEIDAQMGETEIEIIKVTDVDCQQIEEERFDCVYTWEFEGLAPQTKRATVVYGDEIEVEGIGHGAGRPLP